MFCCFKVGYRVPKFGVHGWALKPIALPLTTASTSAVSAIGGSGGCGGGGGSDASARWFVRLLLEGKVDPRWISAVSSHLSDSPALITAS